MKYITRTIGAVYALFSSSVLIYLVIHHYFDVLSLLGILFCIVEGIGLCLMEQVDEGKWHLPFGIPGICFFTVLGLIGYAGGVYDLFKIVSGSDQIRSCVQVAFSNICFTYVSFMLAYRCRRVNFNIIRWFKEVMTEEDEGEEVQNKSVL